jgi:hypothetical protein
MTRLILARPLRTLVLGALVTGLRLSARAPARPEIPRCRRLAGAWLAAAHALS